MSNKTLRASANTLLSLVRWSLYSLVFLPLFGLWSSERVYFRAIDAIHAADVDTTVVDQLRKNREPPTSLPTNFEQELDARGKWGASIELLIVSCVIAYGVSMWIIVRSCLQAFGRKRLVILPAAVFIVVIALVGWIDGKGWAAWDYQLELNLRLRYVLAFNDPTLNDVLFALNRQVAVGSIAIAVAMGVVLLPPIHEWVQKRPVKPEPLSRQYMRLQQLLWTGSLMLVIGILEISLLHSWLTFVVGESHANQTVIKGIASFMVTISAACFSIQLAMAYLPSLLCINCFAWELARKDSPDGLAKERVEWLTSKGLYASSQIQLVRILSLLAPIIAKEFSPVLEKLIS